MSDEITNCPNCGADLQENKFFKKNVKLLGWTAMDLIHEYKGNDVDRYCTKCGKDIFKDCKKELKKELAQLTEKLQKLNPAIPVLSTHHPVNWDYTALGIVTGQTTTGTGVISEFSSSITDIFGAQAGRYNKKLRHGENICMAQLRQQTLELGGNAVIATDIDYAELGGVKGMIMVCMAGTAVKLKNTEVLESSKARHIDKLVSANDRIQHLSKYTK